MMPFVDVLIAGAGGAADMFGIRAGGGMDDREGCRRVAAALAARFGFKKVCFTLRESLSASDNLWAGMLMDGGESFFSRTYALRIVDRVGGGDSFAAGLIYALLSGYDPQRAVEFATAAGALKHSVEGDFNHVSLDEVTKLMDGDGGGRVQR
jgi:2-dehydro-3-deoxygluconokinase